MVRGGQSLFRNLNLLPRGGKGVGWTQSGCERCIWLNFSHGPFQEEELVTYLLLHKKPHLRKEHSLCLRIPNRVGYWGHTLA